MATKDTHYEPYYVPEQSKFPLFASFGLFLFVFGLGNLLNDNTAGQDTTFSGWLTFAGFFVFACVLYNWFATTIRENHMGLPSAQVKRSYVLGMYWFIFSEVMFFAAFFGALFYVRYWAIPWLGGEGEKGIANMLWPDFVATWPVVDNPNTTLFNPPGETMEWPGLAGLYRYLPLWNTIFLLSSSVKIGRAHV